MSGDFYTVLGFLGHVTIIALELTAPIVRARNNAKLVKRLTITTCVIAVFAAGCFAMGAAKYYREKWQSAKGKP